MKTYTPALILLALAGFVSGCEYSHQYRTIRPIQYLENYSPPSDEQIDRGNESDSDPSGSSEEMPSEPMEEEIPASTGNRPGSEGGPNPGVFTDLTPPQITMVSVLGDSRTFRVEFDEPMASDSLTEQSIYLLRSSPNGLAPVNGTLEIDAKTLKSATFIAEDPATFDRDAQGAVLETVYILNILGGELEMNDGVKDKSGNSLESNSGYFFACISSPIPFDGRGSLRLRSSKRLLVTGRFLVHFLFNRRHGDHRAYWKLVQVLRDLEGKVVHAVFWS
jgi:hypothetical protein